MEQHAERIAAHAWEHRDYREATLRGEIATLKIENANLRNLNADERAERERVRVDRDERSDENARLRAELSKAEAERNAAREDLDRTQRVLAKIDAVRTHQSEKLVRVYEASGAEPEHYDNLHAFVGVMRRLIDAVEAMGYEWRWTKSIDADGEQVGAWVMRDATHANTTDVPVQNGGEP
jgi:chromosome segregation ATPase